MFDDALDVILKHEGGYSHDKRDPGGETNFGITKRVAHDYGYIEDMRTIPMAVVRDIYRRGYWNKIKGDQMTWPVALVVFDAAVNSGPRRAAEWLQTVIGANIDGSIGEQTLALVRDADPDEVAHDFSDLRLTFLKSLPTWKDFGRGWEKRVKETLRQAIL